MRKYEMVVVFHPTLNKEGLEAEVNKVKDLITSKGAADVMIKPWGRREIAYPVRKQKYGNYYAFYFNTEQHDTPAAAAAVFRINEQILKFQTHVIDEHTRRFHGNPRRMNSDETFEDILDNIDDMDDGLA